MVSLRSAVGSFGFLMTLSTMSLPVWAAPELEDPVPTASNLGETVSVSKQPFKVESTPSKNLIKKANVQLGIDIARNAPNPELPSFRWQSELLDSQRRSQTGYQFLNSDL